MTKTSPPKHRANPVRCVDKTLPGLGWREFFERLGNGTLPAAPRRTPRAVHRPVQSFVAYTPVSDSR
ncbi:hypothetical protein [Rhodobacter sp. TJ_12]|uniref:hypothetical protein n=1 Tax=Rhodobacter sp. TJ_12 TaxID=2029399 RepID=UPI001CC0C1C5|nr:hypothetical protein [Rhodobacter sp. TJ_12]